MTDNTGNDVSKVNVKFRVMYSGEFGFNETFALNISRESVFVETFEEMGKEGDKMELILTTPDETLEVAVFVELTRYSYDSEGDISGAEFKFLLIEPKLEEELNKFIADLLSKREVMGKRENVRISARFPLEFPDNEDIEDSHTKNISQGGLFFHSESQLEVGNMLKILCKNPLTDEKLELDSEIVMVRQLQDEDNKVYGIGVKYTELSEELKKTLEKFIRDWILR